MPSATHNDLQARASCPTRLNVVRSLLDEDETLLEITTLKFKSMFHTVLQEVVVEQGERGWHKLGNTIFYKFSFGHRACLELACKTKPIGSVSSFRAETFCKSMVRPGRQSCVGCYFKNMDALCVHVVDSSPCCLFFDTPRLSSIRAGDQSLMRVLLRFG